MKIKKIHLDKLIIFLLTWVMLIDTINGYFKLNFSDLNLPISQGYKFLIIAFVSFRILGKKQFYNMVPLLFLILVAPTFIQYAAGNSPDLFTDFTKSIKYLTPVVFYIYFSCIYKEGSSDLNRWLNRFILISFIILVANIFLKWFGLGFSLYKGGQLGSKGFFYAGNEISGVLLILYAIIAYRFIRENKQIKFWLFFILCLYAAFYLGSKTAIAGILITAFFIKINLAKIFRSSKRIGNVLIMGVIVLPLVLVLAIKGFVSSEIFQKRIMFFSEKFDMTTLILSQRNVFLDQAFTSYWHQYNLLEKILGVGQSTYMKAVEKSVEMDFFDLLFTHGIVGVLIFLLLIIWVLLYSYKYAQRSSFGYARLTFIMAVLLFFISTLVGHTFSSGMAGIFIGYIFALGFKRT